MYAMISKSWKCFVFCTINLFIKCVTNTHPNKKVEIYYLILMVPSIWGVCTLHVCLLYLCNFSQISYQFRQSVAKSLMARLLQILIMGRNTADFNRSTFHFYFVFFLYLCIIHISSSMTTLYMAVHPIWPVTSWKSIPYNLK